MPAGRGGPGCSFFGLEPRPLHLRKQLWRVRQRRRRQQQRDVRPRRTYAEWKLSQAAHADDLTRRSAGRARDRELPRSGTTNRSGTASATATARREVDRSGRVRRRSGASPGCSPTASSGLDVRRCRQGQGPGQGGRRGATGGAAAEDKKPRYDPAGVLCGRAGRLGGPGTGTCWA